MNLLQQQPLSGSRINTNRVLETFRHPCTRCHGLVVETFCISPSEGDEDFQIRAMKCLQCGDLFDTQILENQMRSDPRQRSHNTGARKP